jgi:hypothetical protein
MGGGKGGGAPTFTPDPEPIPERPKETVSKQIRDAEKKRLKNKGGHRGNISSPLGVDDAGVNALGQIFS